MMFGHLLGALVATTAPAFDPQHATLEQVISAADEAQIDVVIARLQLASVEQDERGSYAYILPRVDLTSSLSGTYIAPQHTYNVYPVTTSSGALVFQVQQADLPGYPVPDFNIGVRAVQPLYDGGRWWTAIDKGKLDTSAAKANLAEARLKAHSGVAHDFYEVVRASRQLQVLESNVQRSQSQLERAEGMYEAGKGTKGDILAARVNLATDRIAVLQQQATVDLDKTALNVVLGRGAREPLEVVSPDLSLRPTLARRADLEQRAEEHRPMMERMRQTAHSTRLATRMASADYYPSVNVSANYVRDSWDPLLVVGNPTKQYVVQGSLNLAWNLFEGHTTDVAVQKATLAEAQADANLEASRRSLAQEVEHAARSLEVAAASAELAENARAVAAEALEVFSERFRLGASTNLEVRDAQLKLTQAELTLLGTQIDLQLADIDVRAATGDL